MRTTLRRRFWVESGLGVLTAVLAVATSIWPQWIELVFQVDPDLGSGSLEWAIVLAALVATIVGSALAGFEWRRARRPARA
jgi:hypothetical protein